MGGDGPGDGHPLLLAARHLGGLVVPPVPEGHPLHGVLDPLPADAGAEALVDEGQLHILISREGWDEVIPLKNKSDLFVPHMGLLPVGQVGDVLSVQVVLPIGGDVQQSQHVHQGGLAGAGLAHDGHEFAPVDLEGDPVQGPDLPLLPFVVDLVDIPNVNEHCIIS